MAEPEASVGRPRVRAKSHKKKSPSEPAPAKTPPPEPKRKAEEVRADEPPPEPASEPPHKVRREVDVVDLEAEPEVKCEQMRFFTCHNHHTAFGSGHASTLVCAPDVQCAQTVLDAWLEARELKPLRTFPYQLHEVDCTMRRVVVVSPDDTVRADTPVLGAHTASAARRVQWSVYAYQDIPIEESAVPGKYVTAGAVLIAEDEFDAATILTEKLWEKGLLMRSVCVSPESMEKISRTMQAVVPLSLYMWTE
jgi:hypothetical protein